MKSAAVMPEKSSVAADRPPAPAPRTRGGFLVRRECWCLTRRAWLTLVGLIGVALFLFVWRVQPFLAVTDRVPTDILVVEGWIPNYALEASIREFRSRPYRILYTVGGDILNGHNVEVGDNHAEYAITRMKFLGMDTKLTHPVPSGANYRNRTFGSARALRRFFEEQKIAPAGFNVVTVGTHARRSRLLFEKAFEGKVRIGIIAVEDREYDSKRWYRYSSGVKEVIMEVTAFVYTKLFFSAENEDQPPAP